MLTQVKKHTFLVFQHKDTHNLEIRAIEIGKLGIHLYKLNINLYDLHSFLLRVVTIVSQ